MICSFLVTITLLISAPTKKDSQGILKVIQHSYNNALEANTKARKNLLLLIASTDKKTYPKVVGVSLQKMPDFPCK